MANGKLTARQQRFVDAYDGNATRAAIAAGYSEKTARSMGQRLLTYDDIQEAIRAREKKRSKPVIATREERQAFWTNVMNDESQKMQDRLRAAELLGKSEADFIERRELTGRDGAPLIEPVKIQFVD